MTGRLKITKKHQCKGCLTDMVQTGSEAKIFCTKHCKYHYYLNLGTRKTCIDCGVDKSLENFSQTAGLYGCRPYCKECFNKKKRKKCVDKIRTCITCGESFVIGKRGTLRKMFCSNKCDSQFRRNNLLRSYVRGRLIENGINNPTESEIQLKRMQLQLNRAIYEKQREIKSSGNHGQPVNVL